MRTRLKITWNLIETGKYTFTQWTESTENEIEELESLLSNALKGFDIPLRVVFENGNKAIIPPYVLRNCVIEIITENDTQEKD